MNFRASQNKIAQRSSRIIPTRHRATPSGKPSPKPNTNASALKASTGFIEFQSKVGVDGEKAYPKATSSKTTANTGNKIVFKLYFAIRVILK